MLAAFGQAPSRAFRSIRASLGQELHRAGDDYIAYYIRAYDSFRPFSKRNVRTRVSNSLLDLSVFTKLASAAACFAGLDFGVTKTSVTSLYRVLVSSSVRGVVENRAQ